MKLIGKHEQVVSLLSQRLRDISESKDVPRVVVIEGARGTGKTAIIQEFYKRLKRERGDEYWPEGLLGWNAILGCNAELLSSEDPLILRRLVNPQWDGCVWRGGVLPTFSWWGFSGEDSSDEASASVVCAARRQFLTHMLPLVVACKKLDNPGEELSQSLVDKARDFHDSVLDRFIEPLSDNALDSLGIVIPGLSLVTRMRKAIRNEEFADASELVEALQSVVRRDLPMVVAVEDINLMGPEMAHFLDAISSFSSAPVLVVATALTEDKPRKVYSDWLSRGVSAGLVELMDVPSLGQDDLGQLVHEYAPNTDSGVIGEIASKLSTPLAITTWLNSDRLKSVIEHNDGAIVLSSEVVVPDSMIQVIRDRWSELDKTTQWELIYATVADLDEYIGSDYSSDIFIKQLLTCAPDDFDKFSESEMLRAFELAYNPNKYCWFEGGFACFMEPLLYEDVLDPVLRDADDDDSWEDWDEDDWHRAELTEIWQTGLQLLANWACEHATRGVMEFNRVNLNAAKWLVELDHTVGSEYITGIVEARVIAAVTIAQESARTHNYAEAIKRLENVLTSSDGLMAARFMWGVRFLRADWLGRAGRVSEGIAQYEYLLRDLSRFLGKDHADILVVRDNLARLLAEAGRVDEAVKQSEILWRDRRRMLGADHQDTLIARRNLARLLAKVGCTDEAIKQYEILWWDRRRMLGADHQDTLVARRNLAFWLGEAGRVDEAIEHSEGLLEDNPIRALNVNDCDAFVVRHNLAFWLGEAGRVDEAIEQCRVLVEENRIFLGKDDLSTLSERNHLAYWLGRAGRVSEAIELIEELLKDISCVLHMNYPGTLAARHDLALFLGRAGRVGEAVELINGILEEWYRFSTKFPHDMLSACSKPADWLDEVGRVDKAIEQFESLLEDELKVRGVYDSERLIARHNLAFWLGEAGRVDKAIEQFESLLEDELKVLGEDDPETLTTRHHLAFWLGEAGRVDEAVERFEEIYKDSNRFLGGAHSVTRSAHIGFAFSLGKAGRVDEAVEQYKGVVETSRRVLGENDSHTLYMRDDYARRLGEAGRIEEAIEQFMSVLKDMRRVLRASDLGLFAARHNFANMLAKAGRVDEAIEQYKTQLSERRLWRHLGTNKPVIECENLVSLLTKTGRLDEAIEECKELLEAQNEWLGENDPNTQSTRQTLRDLLKEADRENEAPSAE